MSGNEELILGGADLTPETDPTHPTYRHPALFGIVHPGQPGHDAYVRALRESQREREDEVHPCPPRGIHGAPPPKKSVSDWSAPHGGGDEGTHA